MAIAFARSRYDLRPSTVGVLNEISFMRCTHLRAISQSEFNLRCRLFNHAAFQGLAALGCNSVNSDGWVVYIEVLLLLKWFLVLVC